MQNKKNFYVFCFTLLGILLGFLALEIVDILYIRLLVRDFASYNFGLSWGELAQVNYIFGLIVIFVSGLWGFGGGNYWWKQIYVYKNYSKHKHWLKLLK